MKHDIQHEPGNGRTRRIARAAAATAFAGLAAVATSVVVQAWPTQYPQAGVQPRAAEAAAVTLEGCLVRERDVPGRKPTIVERAGIMEDYILTNVQLIKGSAPSRTGASSDSAGRRGAPAESSPSSPAGRGASDPRSSLPPTGGHTPLYHVTGIDDDRLRQLLNQRVQVDGVFADIERGMAGPGGASPMDDLTEIRASSIREVTGGQCPAR